MRIKLLPLLFLALVPIEHSAACGESLYRVGKGVTYREYTAPLPGNLLIFAHSADSRGLADALSRAGHNVTFTTSTDTFDDRLVKGEFDVVIAPFSESQRVIDTQSSHEATFLPVTSTGDDARQARQQFGDAMRADRHEVRHFLKSIHLALKRRS